MRGQARPVCKKLDTGILDDTLPDKGASSAKVTKAGRKRQAVSSRHLDELLALDEISRQINSSVEQATVLREVVTSAKRLLGADAAWVFLVDQESGDFVLNEFEGVADESVAAGLRLKKGEGLTGLVALEGRPVISDNPTRDPRVTLHSIVERERLTAAMAVPTHARSQLVGVLGVHTRSSRTFSDHEVSLLCRLANQAGIAIQNARLLQRERQQVAELQESNKLIDLQRERLAQSIAIHDRLTALALAGGGLSTLADTLAPLVANPVFVLNRFCEIVASAVSEGVGWPDACDLERMPDLLTSQTPTKRLIEEGSKQGRPVWQAAQPELGIPSHVVAPVKVENAVLGYIVVLESTHLLGDLDFVAIEHAATIAALEMMREKTAFEVEVRLQGDCIEALLSSDHAGEGVIVARAAYLGCNLREAHCFAIVDIDNFGEIVSREEHDESRAVVIKQRLFDLVNAVVRENAPRSLVAAKSDAIITMLNVAQCQSGMKILLEHIRAKIMKFLPEITVSIGVGRECRELASYRKSYEEAQRSLAIIKSAGRRSETVWFEELDVYHILYRSDNVELTRLVERALGPVIAYDRRHDSQLIETLATYLRCGLNVRRCAKDLSVHKNTIVYRLERLQEIGGIDLDDPEERFRLEIALRVMGSVLG